MVMGNCAPRASQTMRMRFSAAATSNALASFRPAASQAFKPSYLNWLAPRRKRIAWPSAASSSVISVSTAMSSSTFSGFRLPLSGFSSVNPCSRPSCRFSNHSVTDPRRYSTRWACTTGAACGSSVPFNATARNRSAPSTFIPSHSAASAKSCAGLRAFISSSKSYACRSICGPIFAQISGEIPSGAVDSPAPAATLQRHAHNPANRNPRTPLPAVVFLVMASPVALA